MIDVSPETLHAVARGAMAVTLTRKRQRTSPGVLGAGSCSSNRDARSCRSPLVPLPTGAALGCCRGSINKGHAPATTSRSCDVNRPDCGDATGSNDGTSYAVNASLSRDKRVRVPLQKILSLFAKT